jgi:hypothetical protein
VALEVRVSVDVDVKKGVSLGVSVGLTVGVTCGIDILQAANSNASRTTTPRTITTPPPSSHYKPATPQRDLRLADGCPTEVVVLELRE